MNAKVNWHNGLTFTGEADTGFTVPLGGKSSAGGEDDGFRPMELIATGLAGCTAMDTISILQKKRQDITEFEVNLSADQAESHPRVFTHISIDYLITGHAVDENAVLRAIQLSRLSATARPKACCPRWCRSNLFTTSSKQARMENQGWLRAGTISRKIKRIRYQHSKNYHI